MSDYGDLPSNTNCSACLAARIDYGVGYCALHERVFRPKPQILVQEVDFFPRSVGLERVINNLKAELEEAKSAIEDLHLGIDAQDKVLTNMYNTQLRRANKLERKLTVANKKLEVAIAALKDAGDCDGKDPIRPDWAKWVLENIGNIK